MKLTRQSAGGRRSRRVTDAVEPGNVVYLVGHGNGGRGSHYALSGGWRARGGAGGEQELMLDTWLSWTLLIRETPRSVGSSPQLLAHQVPAPLLLSVRPLQSVLQ